MSHEPRFINPGRILYSQIHWLTSLFLSYTRAIHLFVIFIDEIYFFIFISPPFTTIFRSLFTFFSWFNHYAGHHFWNQSILRRGLDRATITERRPYAQIDDVAGIGWPPLTADRWIWVTFLGCNDLFMVRFLDILGIYWSQKSPNSLKTLRAKENIENQRFHGDLTGYNAH